MNSFVNQPLDKQMNRENLIDKIEALEDAVGPQPSATIGNLSELSPDAGDQVAGTYYVVDQQTGAIRGYLTATPSEQFPGYHLAFFDNAGVLQFGVSADDGHALAGGGVVILDDDGISILAPDTFNDRNSYKFTSVGSVYAGMYFYGSSDAMDARRLHLRNYGNDNRRIDIEATSINQNARIYIVASGGAGNVPGIDLSSSDQKIQINYSSNDIDTQIKGNADVNLIYADAGTDRVGIGKNNPSYKLDVTGDINFTGDLYDNGVLFSGGGDGWTAYSAVTPTYVSTGADDPTYELNFLNTDLTGTVGVGDRIKWTQNSVVRYGIVTAVTTDTNLTILTRCDSTSVNYDLLPTTDYAVSNFKYSHVKNPLGFPADPANWTVSLTDTSDRSQASPTQNVVYNLGSLSIAIPIGAWNVQFKVQAWGVSTAGQTSAGLHAGLHTANNALPSSALLRGFAAVQGASGTLSAGSSISVSTNLTLAAKTTYYCNAYTPFTGQATIYFYNSTLAPLKVTCVCAYL